MLFILRCSVTQTRFFNRVLLRINTHLVRVGIRFICVATRIVLPETLLMSTQFVTNLQSTNHQISITQAAALIARFDDNVQGILQGDYSTQAPFSKSQTFDAIQINELLEQEGCIGLRIYFGMYDETSAPTTDLEGKIVFVLCGVDEEGNDLNLATTASEAGQIILEDGIICPPICSSPSLINNI